MGGSSSSESSTTTEQTDKRIGAADQAQVATEGGQIQTTVIIEAADAELIESGLARMLDFAAGAGLEASALIKETLGLVERQSESIEAAQDKAGSLIEKAIAESQPAALQGFKVLLLASAAVAAVYVYRKG